MKRRGYGRVPRVPNGVFMPVGLLCLTAMAIAGEGQSVPLVRPKHVLILSSYGRDVAPWNAITPAFKRELARRLQAPVEFHETGPATAHAGKSQPETVFVDYLRKIHATEQPDLVVPVGAAATRFWWGQRESLFPSVPVVIGGVERRLLERLPLGPNDTAVAVDVDIARAGFDPIHELLPSTRNIALVIGASDIERFWNHESRLPAGSVVRFREPNIWRHYRWWILGVLGIIAAQGVTILGLLVQRARRRHAEATENVLASRLITAQEAERRRIARDLHDDLNQRLALLSVELDSAGQVDDPATLPPKLDELAQQVKDLSSEVHKLAYQLHPAKLDQLGLATAARSLCSELSAQSGLPIRFAGHKIPRKLPEKLSLAVFRVLQEALGNILRHSKAGEAYVRLRVSRRHLHLSISDNGCGFSLPGSRAARGLGLLGMEERARLVGGRFRIRSSPGRGTRLNLTVPLEPEPATAGPT